MCAFAVLQSSENEEFCFLDGVHAAAHVCFWGQVALHATLCCAMYTVTSSVAQVGDLCFL